MLDLEPTTVVDLREPEVRQSFTCKDCLDGEADVIRLTRTLGQEWSEHICRECGVHLFDPAGHRVCYPGPAKEISAGCCRQCEERAVHRELARDATDLALLRLIQR